jgi:hypothetical protein
MPKNLPATSTVSGSHKSDGTPLTAMKDFPASPSVGGGPANDSEAARKTTPIGDNTLPLIILCPASPDVP